MHDITLTDDVFLAFEAQLADFARAALTTVGDVVGIGDDFGTDEAALEIGMNHARGLRCGRSGAHRPGAYFLHAGREVGLKPQQFERAADDPIQAWLIQFQFGQEFGAIGLLEL